MAETQATAPTWRPPGGVLGDLVAGARRRVSTLDAARIREAASARVPVAGAFRESLRGSAVAVIAEIKRRSPSKGSLNESIGASERAAAYASGGAAALSVLTEPERFGGSLDDLAAVRSAVSIPLLRKDFIVAPVQVDEAVHAGADAILLIARALDPALAAELAAYATERGLDVLFEIRDEAELARAIAVAGAVIGVNARNLETLEVDPQVSARLIPLIPSDRVAVFESGVSSRADVEFAARLGADAVLVGSALSTQADARAAVGALAGVTRRARG